jgi:hypothetical protein
MQKFTDSELEGNTRKMREKMNDDEDFFNSFGSVRSGLPSDLYRQNYDLIFRRDRVVVDATPATAE